jgi:hypothetical protein
MLRALNDVPALEGRDRLELGVPGNRITANVDRRVRGRAQVFVQRNFFRSA